MDKNPYKAPQSNSPGGIAIARFTDKGLWQNLAATGNRRHGFVLGVLIPWVWTGLLLEFAKRAMWAIRGGAGESAVWGEPLFYMVLFGVPGALIGAIVGFLVGAIIRRAVKHKRQSS
jgi:hypothetical protein